jgi:putative phosphoesterase
MTKIGVLSDTHGFLDEKIVDFLAPCQEVWHAGDIGDIDIINKLSENHIVRAVYGNIDGGLMRRILPEFLSFKCEKISILLTHIGGYPNNYYRKAYQKIFEFNPKIFVCGHSHILKIMNDKHLNMLCINPGAAGTFGFHQARTLLRFEIDGENIQNMEVLDIKKTD